MKKEEIISLWQAIVIVFVASACTLVIEIIAGRLLAPFMGVNLYTWTSIIGVVLAGISLGNYVGGWQADRYASRGLLGLQFFVSSLATLSILPLLLFVTGADWKLPLIVKVLTYVTVIFFLPAFVMGTISPVVVKLSLSDLQRTGTTVGLLYACSTLGSILGTFLTGFWLISTFGTRAIIFGVAAVLALMGILFGDLRPRRNALSITGLLLLLLVVGTASDLIRRDLHKSTFVRETDYFTINISERRFNDGELGLALVLDHLIHSFSKPNDPTFLEYGYERVYAELTAFHAESHPGLRTAFIGGGGYTFPRYIDAVYPNSVAHVVEIDPAVTEVAYERLGVPRNSRIVPFNEDARLFFNEAHYDAPYDIIYGDAFNDLSVPYHLTTAEFGGLVHRALKPDGIYMVNIIDKYQSGGFLRAYLKGLRQNFPHVYLMSVGETWQTDFQNTYVVVATKQPFNLDQFRQAMTRGGKEMQTKIQTAELLEAYLAQPGPTLTDDFAPVDQLLAPLFNERGF